MNGEFIQMIEDTRAELDSIRKWINAGNQFDSKSRYLISYAVVKASGAVEVIFKNMIYNYLSVGANEKAKGYGLKWESMDNILDTNRQMGQGEERDTRFLKWFSGRDVSFCD